MNYKTALESWLNHRLSSSFGYYKLQESCIQEYQFKRNWDASNFAYVQFKCEPAEELSVNWSEEWPQTLDNSEIENLHTSILGGILDAIYCAENGPHHGCALTLIKILWVDAGSSQKAFYLAAKRAMHELISQRTWHMVLQKVDKK
jgi:hypothetical protein